MAAAERGEIAETDVKQLRYENLRDNFRPKQRDEIKKKREDSKWRQLDRFFLGRRVSDMIAPGATIIEDFIESRRDEGTSDPTKRRNLRPLVAVFRRAYKKRLINHLPVFDLPKDSASASEYLEPADFAKILVELDKERGAKIKAGFKDAPDLIPFFSFLYATGCRLGAAQQITWEMVSKDCTMIDLPGIITKNGSPLKLVLAGSQLESLVKMLRKMFRKDGVPVFDSTNYRQEWNKACHAAGFRAYEESTRRRAKVRGFRIHDCRGSAAVNMLDAGVDRDLVMAIGGWKTDAMLRRYNRPTENRLKAAMERSGKFVEAMMNGTK